MYWRHTNFYFLLLTSPQVHGVSLTFVREVESRVIQDESDSNMRKYWLHWYSWCDFFYLVVIINDQMTGTWGGRWLCLQWCYWTERKTLLWTRPSAADREVWKSNTDVEGKKTWRNYDCITIKTIFVYKPVIDGTCSEVCVEDSDDSRCRVSQNRVVNDIQEVNQL